MPDEAVVYSDGSGPDAARTHVLLVGVGHYPNFAKGFADGTEVPLRDLKSPPASARALADWFVTEYHYPPAPIGSVALLVSDERALPYAVPTYDCFDAAAKAWLARGNGNEESRLVFMFCGHGYGYGVETSLLMADFDFAEDNPWDRALDLLAFTAGAEKYRAAEQLFFIDACRRPHGDLVQPGASIGRSPASTKASPREGMASKRKAPIFFSTGANEPARARAGDLSVFTKAFLAAMRGMGARNDTGAWQVNSYSMLEAIDHVSVRLTEEDFADPQQPQGGDARGLQIHTLSQDPISPLYVRCSAGPCGPGELRYRVKGKPQSRQCAAGEEEVDLWLPVGNYNLELKSGATVLGRARRVPSAPTYKTAVLNP